MRDFAAGTPGTGTGRPERHPSADPTRSWQAGAFVLALVASAVLLFLPVYTGVGSSSDGRQVIESATLLQEDQPSVLIVLAVPLLLTATPLGAPRRARRIPSIICLFALAAFVMLAMLTIGWFYLPALVVALVAVLRMPPRMPGPRAVRPCAPETR